MKKFLPCIAVLIYTIADAQKGDELLVYSMKGNVTVIENNKESKLQIGKVLKPGATIKTQKLAKLTMVCQQGKPLSVTKEGVFPVIKWKDSCVSSHPSMTSKYFQYIWDQLYVRSEDYKKEHPDGLAMTDRTEAPVRGEQPLEIEITEALDTVYYAAGAFPLSWSTNIVYTGNFHFILFNSKTGKPVFKDSISGNSIMIDKLKKYMRPGNLYSWSVAAAKTDPAEGGVIRYVPLKTISQQVIKLQRSVDVPEDIAARYFRTAYLLEKSHFPADAFSYYQKAAKADPGTEFYTEMLDVFKKTFNIVSN